MQTLTTLINLGIKNSLWKQFYVCNNGLNINHLIFADDIILFSKGFPLGLWGIQKLLGLFSHSTGQTENLNKSQILLSAKASDSFRNHVCQTLGVQHMDSNSLYLGVPIVLGKKKNHFFQFIINKFGKRVES